MVQSFERGQPEAAGGAQRKIQNPPAQKVVSPTSPGHHRIPRQSRNIYYQGNGNIPANPPIAAQAQAYLEQNVLAWMNPVKYQQMLSNPPVQNRQSVAMSTELSNRELPSSGVSQSGLRYTGGIPKVEHTQLSPQFGQQSHQNGMNGQAAAVSFFTRAAQKLNISSKKKRRREPPEPEPPPFPTNFSDIIRVNPPPTPPCLIRTAGRVQLPGSGKVKVMLRIAPTESYSDSGSFLSTDPRKKQITVYDPAHCGYTTQTQAHRLRAGATAPKMFAFDQVFTPDDSLTEICSTGLSEIVQSVVNGADGCLFCYGHSKLGKSFTMVGQDNSTSNLGAIPCAIAWLFRLINEQKDKTGARFSVRVSAVEVTGKSETLKDLLGDVASTETGSHTSPGVYLREDPICGTQLENQSELRAPTADKAAFYLDAACAARTPPDNEEDARSSHFLFTLHVYQYRVEKNGKSGSGGVAGGRSRLQLLDLGSCCKAKDSGNGMALSLSALGNVILALLNGQRHVPHRDSKLTQLLRESLGSLSCRACMVAHVSPSIQHYNETLQVIQLAARIHRMRRRTKSSKFSSTSSEDSSSCDEHRFGRRLRTGIRMGTLREGVCYSNAVNSTSGEEYTSSSAGELSCDTVIYVGPNGRALSDHEFTDNEGPPSMVPISPGSGRFLPSRARTPSDGANSDSDVTERRLPLSRSGIKLGASASRLPMKSTPPRSQSASGLPQTNKGRESPQTIQLPRKIRPPTPSKPKSQDTQDQNQYTNVGRVPPVSRNHNNWPKIAPYRDETAEEGIHGEQWIDGPGAAIYPESKLNEQWIDGPKEFTVKQKQENLTRHKDSSTNKKVCFEGSARTSKLPLRNSNFDPNDPNCVKLNAKEISRTSEPVIYEDIHSLKTTESVTIETQTDPCDISDSQEEEEQFTGNTDYSENVTDYSENVTELNASSRVPVSSHRFGLPKNRMLEQIKEETSRPVSMHSTESDVSEAVHAPDSRPLSVAQSSDEAVPCANRLMENTREPHREVIRVKPFVRDWVEKHSNVKSRDTEDSQSNKSFDAKLKNMADSVCKNSQRDHNKNTSSVNCDHENVESSSKSHKSNHSSPCNSPALIRKNVESKTPLKKSLLPPSANPSRRTAEWIKAMNLESSSADDSGCARDLNDSFEDENPQNCSRGAGEQMADMPPMMDRDKSYENQLTDQSSNEGRSRPIPLDQLSIHHSETDSEATSNNQGLSQRESIYELEVEEQLEGMRPGELWKIAFDTSDYDSLSNRSTIIKDEEPIVEVMDVEVDITTPVIENVDIKQMFSERLTDSKEEKMQPEQNNGNNNDSPTSDDSDKSDKHHMRPTYFRRPDGASNPNLSKDPSLDEKMSNNGDKNTSETLEQVRKVISQSKDLEASVTLQPTVIVERSVIGQSSEDKQRSGLPVPVGSKFQRKLPIPVNGTKQQAVKNKPPLPNKPASPPKTPGTPKPPPPAKPVRSSSLPRGVKPPSTPVKSVPLKSGTLRSNSVPPSTCSSPVPTGKSKDKSSKLPQKNSSNSSSSHSSPSRSSSSPSRSKSPSAKSTPTKSRLPQSSSKSSIQSKESKSANSKLAKLSSPKKEKESKLPLSKASNSRVTELSKPPAKGTDSDSGNDSGIGDKNSKLLSPYSSLSKVRTSSHSSSGHGSDNSSSVSGVVTKKTDHLQGGTSSGYESMIRDSEVTGTSSSTHDSSNESSAGGRVRGNKIFKKRVATARRSRSAPGRTMDSPSPSASSYKTSSPSPRAWVDTRRGETSKEEPIELKVYDVDDVERLQRRRKEDNSEQRELEQRRKKVKDLLDRQSELKHELSSTKEKLMNDKGAWSYDLHVASQLQADNQNYLEALEKETTILEKRVNACKSHIMIVTCFDITI